MIWTKKTKKCKEIFDHVAIWDGGGYQCLYCGLEFITTGVKIGESKPDTTRLAEFPKGVPQAWKDKYNALENAMNEQLKKESPPSSDKDRPKNATEYIERLEKLEDDFKTFHEMNGAGWKEPWNWILYHAKELGELVQDS